METWMIEVISNAGGLVIVVALFLMYSDRQRKTDQAHWDALHEESRKTIEGMGTQFGELANRLAGSIDAMVKTLSERPCLWERDHREHLARMESIVERMARRAGVPIPDDMDGME